MWLTFTFADSPASITRQDKQYRATISGIYTENSDKNTKALLLSEVVQPAVSDNANVTIAQNQMDESMTEEFTALFQAIALAIFLVFVVMAAQFESPKFSIMVMTTIPFLPHRCLWSFVAGRQRHQHDIPAGIPDAGWYGC